MKGLYVESQAIIRVLNGKSIGIQYPNNIAQLNKCGLHGCAKYALILTAAILTWNTVYSLLTVEFLQRYIP